VLLQFFAYKPISHAPTDLRPSPVARAVELPPVTNPFGTEDALPKELTNETFWKMIATFSEPDGFFMYDNYLSNEQSYQEPIASLKSVVKPGGVYLGVGPEQNFTYIAAVRPAMAFIVDIRRQNMIELLMYKALFQLAANRAEFVSLLFSRKAPAVLNASATADELFSAYAGIQPDTNLFKRNLESITSQLSLSSDDKKTIADIYDVFFSIGPDLNYASVSSYAPSGPSYTSLMTLSDRDGRNWSYLASEENFRFVKEMQRKNLIVPLVGDFAGSKAIRTVAKYLMDHQAKVSAFYVSNVEMYILPSLQWKSFCANVSELPMDESSMFVRFLIGRYARTTAPQSFGPRNMSVISPMIDVLTGTRKGYPPSYYDLIHASK
jgi:hypothetical protein